MVTGLYYTYDMESKNPYKAFIHRGIMSKEIGDIGESNSSYADAKRNLIDIIESKGFTHITPKAENVPNAERIEFQLQTGHKKNPEGK